MALDLKHFKPHEFRCRCGCSLGIDQMDTAMLAMLDAAREYAGIPFKINSAIRCQAHNNSVGGSANSSHLKGLAADIACEFSPARFLMLRELIFAGFHRIGVGSEFIHVDIDKDKPGKTTWLY